MLNKKYFVHIRIYGDGPKRKCCKHTYPRKDRFGRSNTLFAKGGFTICYLPDVENNRSYIGVAICSPEDNFDRKKGNFYSEKDALCEKKIKNMTDAELQDHKLHKTYWETVLINDIHYRPNNPLLGRKEIIEKGRNLIARIVGRNFHYKKLKIEAQHKEEMLSISEDLI